MEIDTFETIDNIESIDYIKPFQTDPTPYFMDETIDTFVILKDGNISNTSKDKTIFMFDWDDTLMCTTFMESLGITLHSDSILVHEHWTDLDNLSKSIIDIITLCKEYGDVVIITNAEYNWVQLSSQKFMPELIPIIKTIPIFSARSKYQNLYPGDPYMWKYMTMKYLLDTKPKKNIISFGDSLIERSSMINIAKNIQNSLPKSVKFSDRPTIKSIKQQLDLLKTSIKYISEYNGHLDLQLRVLNKDQERRK